MLKQLTRLQYKHRIYTNNQELFYEFYKWNLGLEALFGLRKFAYILIGVIIFIATSSDMILRVLLILSFLAFVIFFENLLYSLSKSMYLVDVDFLSSLGKLDEIDVGALVLTTLFRKWFVTKNGKAITKNDWKKIKRENQTLYNDLLSDASFACCHSYSLDLAKLITDATLVWCAVDDPLEKGPNYYAHAIIVRNGEVYDTNSRYYLNFADYAKLYNLKLYKEWKYDEYSSPDFRDTEREAFYNWCVQNGVKSYVGF